MWDAHIVQRMCPGQMEDGASFASELEQFLVEFFLVAVRVVVVLPNDLAFCID